MFPPYIDELKAYLPQFKIEFKDLGLKKDDEIQKLDPVFLVAAFLMHKYSHNEEVLFSRFDQWITLLGDIQKNRNQFKIIAVYYFEMLKERKTEIMEKIKDYPTSVKGELMSVADQLRHEGIEQGIERKEYIAIKNMIHRGMETEFICDVLEVSREKVESIRRKMKRQS